MNKSPATAVAPSLKKRAEEYLNPKMQKFEPYSPNSGITGFEIRLDANESFFELPEYILEDVKGSMQNINFNRYPDPAASELIRAYAAYLKAAENAEVKTDNIAAGNGSDELLSIIINSFLSKGDKILTFVPDFSMYAFYGDIIEADVIKVQKSGGDNFAIDFGEIADRVNREKIKLVVFSNPCNPTGRLEQKETLEKFIRSVDAVVVADEVYMSFAEDKKNQSFLYDFLEYPNLIVMKSLSKSIGLAAIRVGFALSNEVFIDMVKTIKSPYNLNSVSQEIAKTVLGYPGCLSERLDAIVENKKKLQKSLKTLFGNKMGFKVYDTETNFVLIETDRAKDIFGFLLENKILVRNLGGKFLRITAGSDGENEKLIECLGDYLCDV